MRFRLHAAGEEREARIGLLGRHMVYPALAAVAVAVFRGEPLDEVLPRLAALPPALNRLIPRPLPNGALLLLDARKSALETIHAALDVLAEIPAARKIVVLGPINEPMGGPRAQYRTLGARIARIAQLAVFVDSYRGYERGVRQAGMSLDACFDAGKGISAAVEFLSRELRPGDVALIKGRNSQKLERIALALEGRPVRCSLVACQLQAIHCDYCPMLEQS
jgi:UDP-N-acetylmuramyl pentapeptide synthase